MIVKADDERTRDLGDLGQKEEHCQPTTHFSTTPLAAGRHHQSHHPISHPRHLSKRQERASIKWVRCCIKVECRFLSHIYHNEILRLFYSSSCLVGNRRSRLCAGPSRCRFAFNGHRAAPVRVLPTSASRNARVHQGAQEHPEPGCQRQEPNESQQ